MKIRLIPREERFYDLFEQASTNIVEGARLLAQMVRKYDEAESYSRKILEVEHEGDITTHEIMERLNRTFITPIDHEDIRAISSGLDDVLDYIEATADRMLLYEVGTPGQEMIDLVDVLAEATIQVDKAVRMLRDLKQSRRILDHCIEINRLENEGDRMSRAALAKLFKTADPINAIKWREIYEHVETAIDKCEDVANAIEGVMVKHG